MASLYKKPIVKKNPQSGKKIRTKSRKWWGRYRDASGRERRVPLAADKSAAQTMLNNLVRKTEREVAGLADPFEAHAKTPFSTHLMDFKTHLEHKGGSKGHIETTYQRARDIVDLAGFRFINDVAPSPILAVLAAKRNEGISISSSNHYLRASKMFTRWLVRDRRTGDDRLVHLATLNEDTDRRRIHRPLTTEELSVLLDKTRSHKQPRRRLKGPDRVMLYMVAVYTGLRRSEIASITSQSFSFESNPPTVTVEAGYSKRRRKDILPLRHDFAERLQAWIAGNAKLKTTSVLFPIRRVRTSQMLKNDLDNAREQWIKVAPSVDERKRREESSFLAYEDERGRVVDFHSLRKTFITNLTKSGVSPKTAQLLARHSDINLTMNTYTSLGVLDQAAAVEALPPIPAEAVEEPAQVLQATGTDDQVAMPSCQKKVPVLVPRGAQNGAKRLAPATLRLAPECTETRIEHVRRERIETRENPKKNGPIRTRKGQSASLDIQVPEVGVEPTRPCGHWILSQGGEFHKSQSDQELEKGETGEVPSVVPSPQQAILVPPELVEVVHAWEHLPHAIRQGVLALVRAAGGDDA